MILRGVVYGAAIGDALGVPYEFRGRGTFECTGMAGYGTHGKPAGTFSDDTSMLIATCDSYRVSGCVDLVDMRRKFEEWLRFGFYTCDGDVFDVGGTTSRAIGEGRGMMGENDNGNGSLMRIAPVAFMDASDDDVRSVSAITHAHETSTEACVEFVRVIRRIATGASVSEATKAVRVGDYAFCPEKPSDQVRSGGYVLDTLDAALWCLVNTDSYAECVLKAVNLGRDTDTTGCVAGALAGAVYGFEAIPDEWIEVLKGKDVIESCLF